MRVLNQPKLFVHEYPGLNPLFSVINDKAKTPIDTKHKLFSK